MNKNAELGKQKEKVKLTEKVLMKMTLMDDELLEKVKKVEINYFITRFGSEMKNIKEIDYCKLERSVLLRCNSLIYDPIEKDMAPVDFVKKMRWVENMILSSIRLPGIVCKCIYNVKTYIPISIYTYAYIYISTMIILL